MPSKLKLFISYSHQDETKINEFRKHINPLKESKLIEDWYDRKILGGDELQQIIDANLESADIICLFISHNFLSSKACLKEIDDAYRLRNEKGIKVIAIILSPCAWTDVKELSKFLAFPTDGKAISSYNDENEGWVDVYAGIKRNVEYVNHISSLTLKDKWLKELNDATVFAKAHPAKDEITLEDIFVFPEITCFDVVKGKDRIKTSQELITNFVKNTKLVLIGEDQSGKTALAKMIYKGLFEERFIPVFIYDEQEHLQGDINYRIKNSFENQYEGANYDDLDKTRIVPIIDNFHKAKNKAKHINSLADYNCVILVIDDISGINIKEERLLNDYKHYKLLEYKASLRYELIKRWLEIGSETIGGDTNGFYKDIDQKVELVNSSLGKILGGGIMPSFPFFILSIISTYDTFKKPLEQEITSQGYCYQALIFYFLSKQGVKSDDIDFYVNFLAEFAYYLFNIRPHEINESELNDFFDSYESRFNSKDRSELLKNLLSAQILSKNTLGAFSFYYPYLYYFFIAKYFADKLESIHTDKPIKDQLDAIIHNLHTNENAYIAIFIAHHSKSNYLLDEVTLNAMCFFDKNSPATLSTSELAFFEKKAKILIHATLPEKNHSGKERYQRIQRLDETEQNQSNFVSEEEELDIDMDDRAIEFATELRRSIKTVEVMGHIIKNRAGSLEKEKLEEIFENGMNVHLRVLSYFFALIENEKATEENVDFIMRRLNKLIEKSDKGLTRDALEKKAREIFWNLNFMVIYSLVEKIVFSLGSDKLINVIISVCDRINTPASFIIKENILMWYNKNLRIGDMGRIKEKDFSSIAYGIIKINVTNHCRLHSIAPRDLDKVKHTFGLENKEVLKLGQ